MSHFFQLYIQYTNQATNHRKSVLFLLLHKQYGGDNMITPMIISFRECLEMLIIIIPLLAFLTKVEKRYLSKFVYGGGIAGAALASIIGIVLFKTTQSLEGYTQQIFLGSLMLFISGLILYNIAILRKQSKNITLDTTQNSKDNLTSVSLFLLAFTTIFRESLEIVMFLIPMFNESPITIGTGIISGIAASLIVMALIYKTALKLNINVIFSIMTLILILIGASMFGEALGIFFPDLGTSLILAGKLIYGIPLVYLFAKKELKRYIKKI